MWEIITVNGIETMYVLVKNSTPQQHMLIGNSEEMNDLIARLNAFQSNQVPDRCQLKSLLPEIKTVPISRCAKIIEDRATYMCLNFNSNDIVAFDAGGKVFVVLAKWTEKTTDDKGLMIDKEVYNVTYELGKNLEGRVCIRAPHLCFMIEGNQITDGGNI